MGKTIIYQMLPRLWGSGRFSSVDDRTFDHMKSLSVTHVWYTGIIRHSTGQPFVKGNFGSPYAVSDYYDVNPYLADNVDSRMAEFENLVNRTHAAGLKVIIDFVPNHVGRDYGRHRVRTDIPYLGDGDDSSRHWAEDNDFFYYPGEPLRLPLGLEYDEMPARATGNAYTPSPSADDWYDTVKINYCDTHTATWDRMLDILLFWASKGVDGFRCDMAELVPKQFFTWAIGAVKEKYPDLIFIAEIYTKESYSTYVREVGFDLLYDKSGLYDSLKAIVKANAPGRALPPEIYQSTRTLTWNWQFLGGLQGRMLNFLENHDEQRFASDAYAGDAAREVAPLMMASAFNEAPAMIYFGEEFGESAPQSGDGRTSIFDYVRVGSIDRLLSGSLTPAEEMTLARFREILGFASRTGSWATYDLCFCNQGSEGFDSARHFAYLRHSDEGAVLVFLNFGAAPSDATVAIPQYASEAAGVPQGEVRVHVAPFEASTTILR